MPGKIFISCGQANPEEIRIATEVSNWLTTKGFTPYVAIETQSIQDVNSEIIGNLKLADYYVFIDFRRETISHFPKESRGSLFTNQELSIAYILGFDKVIFIQQSGIKLEGIGKYLLSNAAKFNKKDEILSIVQDLVKNRKWMPDYSRHLVPSSVKLLSSLTYSDKTRVAQQYICHVEIQNRRHDFIAFSTIAFLDSITLPANQTISPDVSYLKWAGQDYERTILPGYSAKFDAFAIDDKPNYDQVWLHSMQDLTPRQQIIQRTGKYILHYRVASQGFPVSEFDIVLDITGNINTTTAQIR